MARVRIGAVGYLNARPLVFGLERRADRFEIRFDVPSECARLLRSGVTDLGLVPAVEFLQDADYRIVPGVAVASKGPVESVALYARRPIAEVTSIALDRSSNTSAMLVRVLSAARWRIDPTFVEAAPNLEAMTAGCDAALMIGDPALFAQHEALGLEKIDLGAEWTAFTGLPFVWAFWAGRSGALAPADIDVLQAARDAGVEGIDAIAHAHAAGDDGRRERIAAYLRNRIRYHLDGEFVEGLRRFYALASGLGLAPSRSPAFYD